MRSMFTWKSMTLRPQKHRKGAIFHRKMCGFEVFQDFGSTECGEIRGIMGAKYLLAQTSYIIDNQIKKEDLLEENSSHNKEKSSYQNAVHAVR